MISAREALQQLREGNLRFASGDRIRGSKTSQEFRDELAAEQTPFAVVLGCSDSRVPAEIVFDQGLGDLFVIRVAGNIVAPSQSASVEFATKQLGARLVVVLGHSRCGAVQATLEELRHPNTGQPGNMHAIVSRIRSAVEAVIDGGPYENPEELMHRAVHANVQASAAQLQHGSEVLDDLIRNKGLLIVGAVYSLETGLVEFLDGAPA